MSLLVRIRNGWRIKTPNEQRRDTEDTLLPSKKGVHLGNIGRLGRYG
jgi:hypothetical protein